MEKEKFKPVKNYEGLYEISNLGTLRSLDKKWQTLNYKSGKYITVKMKGRIIKTCVSNCGYEQTTLSKNGKQKLVLIHRLVAEAFILNTNNYPCVNHKDGNKLNNCVDNLEWCTYSYNEKHAYKNGYAKSYLKDKYGKEHPLSKKVKQYDLKGNFIKKWNCISDVTRALGIDSGRITKCCQHQKYCHSAGGFKWEYDI